MNRREFEDQIGRDIDWLRRSVAKLNAPEFDHIHSVLVTATRLAYSKPGVDGVLWAAGMDPEKATPQAMAAARNLLAAVRPGDGESYSQPVGPSHDELGRLLMWAERCRDIDPTLAASWIPAIIEWRNRLAGVSPSGPTGPRG